MRPVGNLRNKVIKRYERDYTFTRLTTTSINNIGREVQSSATSTIRAYIHPASDRDLTNVNQQGYHFEGMIKIFAPVDADIIQDDRVAYDGNTYRVIKDNKKIVGSYLKLHAGLING